MKTKRNYFFLFLSSIFILSSCYREPELSTRKISDQKMIEILTDVHLAEAKLTEFAAKPEVFKDSIAKVYYNNIFKIHQVKREEYDQCMNALMKNPDALSKIYEKVLEKLQKDETKILQ
jgi:hypothetical protein